MKFKDTKYYLTLNREELNKMIRSGGSHDVVVRYSFDLNFSKKDKYKSERIL